MDDLALSRLGVVPILIRKFHSLIQQGAR